MPLSNPRLCARISGALYLTIALCGGFSIGYLPALLTVEQDAAATAANVLAHPGLVRLGIIADIIVLLCEVVLSGLLFALLRPVNALLSLIAAFSRLLMVSVMGLNLVLHAASLLLLGDAPSLAAFTPDQLNALSLMFEQARGYGVYAWGLFFGLHLLILGGLVAVSGYFPRWPGYLMALGALGYLTESLAAFALPDVTLLRQVAIGLLAATVAGELSFALWLLICGLRQPEWDRRVPDLRL